MNDQDQINKQTLVAARWVADHIHEIWSNESVAVAQGFELTLIHGMCKAEVMILTPSLAKKIKQFMEDELAEQVIRDDS